MGHRVLEQLCSDDFAVSVGFHSNPAALRRRLARMGEVAAIREALQQGAISEQTIRRFVSHLVEDFTSGEHFVHEDALAALCVALERRPTDFAEEFLHDLSRLRLAEMSLCIRVSRECQKHRGSVGRRTVKVFQFLDRGSAAAFPMQTSARVSQHDGSKSTGITRVCEVAQCQN